tara:strand:- start:742 stop:1053 length:312 start_codon:yes stop_codon:yes gene_type:complete
MIMIEDETMDSRYLPIKDQLELACMQAMKDDMAVDRIDLSYDAMDRLMATDPLSIHHKSFGNVEWSGIRINPVGNDIFGNQYHLVTRPLKPSEAGHTIRGKLP